MVAQTDRHIKHLRVQKHICSARFEDVSLLPDHITQNENGRLRVKPTYRGVASCMYAAHRARHGGHRADINV